MNSDLKPCPFCGEAVEMNDYTDKPVCAWVIIHRCKVIGPIKLESYSGEILQEEWNTRAAADALTAAQEENERLVHDIERLSASLSAEVTGSERLREALSLMANRLRHEITIKPDLTFNDAIEWVEELTRAALDGLPK